ncbi:hypothetical protein [Bifidobacterium porcinum]
MTETSRQAYWESLFRSFDKQFIDKARREYDSRNRSQAHRTCETEKEES